jgi:hypothetical protein
VEWRLIPFFERINQGIACYGTVFTEKETPGRFSGKESVLRVRIHKGREPQHNDMNETTTRRDHYFCPLFLLVFE